MPSLSLNLNLTLKPLTNLVDVATDKSPEKKKTLQLITYFTHPCDDIIQAVSVPFMAINAHYNRDLDASIFGTLIWMPTKVVLKTICVSLPLGGKAILSIFLPYRTFLDLYKFDKKIEFDKPVPPPPRSPQPSDEPIPAPIPPSNGTLRKLGKRIRKHWEQPGNCPRYLSRLATQIMVKVEDPSWPLGEFHPEKIAKLPDFEDNLELKLYNNLKHDFEKLHIHYYKNFFVKALLM